MRVRNTVAGLTVLLASAGASSAGPEVTVDRRYYTVTGDTPAEVRRALDNQTPVIFEGERYDAFTDWTVDWSIRWYDHGSRCTVTEVEADLIVEMTMPRLDAGHGLSDSGLSEWKRYRDALQAHENGHKAFGVRCAREIKRKLRAMEPRATCDRLYSDAKTLADAIIEKYAGRERDYDRRTRYGRTQGAVFPRR
jgi:predicted secreted Zn-dependent protease